jgi:hypothetical protein
VIDPRENSSGFDPAFPRCRRAHKLPLINDSKAPHLKAAAPPERYTTALEPE